MGCWYSWEHSSFASFSPRFDPGTVHHNWLLSSVWQNSGLQSRMSVVRIHQGSPKNLYPLRQVGKALDFDSSMRWFESIRGCQNFSRVAQRKSKRLISVRSTFRNCPWVPLSRWCQRQHDGLQNRGTGFESLAGRHLLESE